MARVTVKGRARMHANAAVADRRAREGAADAVVESAEAISDDARDGAPVDTSQLRDDIGAEADGLSATVGVFGPSAEYAPYVHDGTSVREPDPFMLTAAERERGRLPDRVRRHVREGLR